MMVYTSNTDKEQTRSGQAISSSLASVTSFGMMYDRVSLMDVRIDSGIVDARTSN